MSTFLSQCVTSIQIEFGFALHLHPAFPLESQYGIKKMSLFSFDPQKKNLNVRMQSMNGKYLTIPILEHYLFRRLHFLYINPFNIISTLT